MRSVVIALSAFSLVLSAAPAYAQAATTTPAPFPQGARVGIVDLQRIAALSVEGKAASEKAEAFIAQKQDEATVKSEALEDNKNGLQQGGALLNDAARVKLEKEIERQQIDADRFQQDAQGEINDLQAELQAEFQQKLFPILSGLVEEKGLHVLLSASDAGVILADPAIDLTLEAIRRFDAATARPAAAPTPSPES